MSKKQTAPANVASTAQKRRQIRTASRLGFLFLLGGLLLAAGCNTVQPTQEEQLKTLKERKSMILVEAAAAGRMDLVQKQLEDGADAETMVKALLIASICGHADSASLLIDKGANIDVAMGEVRKGIAESGGADQEKFQQALKLLGTLKCQRETASFPEFQAKAKAWREMQARPPLPDEVIRLRVLAEDAYQNKEFERAVDFYEKGLAMEPLWSDGQFNAAILDGELGHYAEAAMHMRRYLELSPDSKDAKAARNKMYVWDEKAREASTTDTPTNDEQNPAGKRKARSSDGSLFQQITQPNNANKW
jgi:tetratricopeptide (TPR) repeat protein